MLHEFQIVFLMWKMSLQKKMQYALHFWIQLLGMIFIATVELFSVYLLVEKFGNFAGLRWFHLCIFFGTIQISAYFAEIFLRGFDIIDYWIRPGNYDRILLRPMSSFLQVLGADFDLRRLGRIFIALGALFYGISFLESFSFFHFFLLLYALFSSFLVYAAAFIIQASLCFWTIDPPEGMNILHYGSSEINKYPLFAYPKLIRYLFFCLFPVASCTYLPLMHIIQIKDPLNLPLILLYIGPLFGVFYFILSVFFFHFAERRYTSAGG